MTSIPPVGLHLLWYLLDCLQISRMTASEIRACYMLGVSTVVIITLEVVNYISCTDLYATPMSMSWSDLKVGIRELSLLFIQEPTEKQPLWYWLHLYQPKVRIVYQKLLKNVVIANVKDTHHRLGKRCFYQLEVWTIVISVNGAFNAFHFAIGFNP